MTVRRKIFFPITNDYVKNIEDSKFITKNETTRLFTLNLLETVDENYQMIPILNLYCIKM